MRLVVPYTDLRAATLRATRSYPGAEYIYVGDGEYEYSALLRELWADGEGFLLCEHDMEPTREQINHMERCPNGLCAGVYEWTTCIGPALGFTRFRSDFIATYPHVMEIASRIPSNYGKPGHWKQMDVWVLAAVCRDFYGEQPCCHLPPVRHLNEGQRLLDIHRGKPVVTSVQGRTYLPPGLVASIAADVLADSREHGT